MKRKTKNIVTYCGILVGIVLFTVTAFAAVEQVSGYEAIKSAAADALLQKNFTCKISGEANLNRGQEREDFEIICQLDGKKVHLTTYNNGEFNDETFEDQNRQLYRHSLKGEFYEMKVNSSVSDSITFDKVRLAEVFIDLMMGEAKNEVVTEGDHVSLSLNRQQIPSVMQLAMTVMAESLQMEYGVPKGPELEAMGDFFQLSQVTIEQMKGEGRVDDRGDLAYVQIYFQISGRSADGTMHRLEMKLEAQFDDVGSTVVEMPKAG